MSQFKIGEHYDPTFKKLDALEIQQNLEGICYEIKEEAYTKQLTDADLAERKTDLAEVSIEISELEYEKKQINQELRAKIKTPKAVRAELLEAIKHRSEHRKGKLFLVDEPESSMMYYFDSEGICVHARPMKPSEKQIKIRTLKNASNE
ncbi:hypothetical protein [Leeuwenhoekiella sp. LLG6367-2.1]|uniref:hypothetical protein n=1 Tax=Leeuwenhoekiella sp. LLG6367-2.1 TaxID=3160833 RepID=UPI003865DC57